MIKVFHPFCNEFWEIMSYIDETIIGKRFEIALRKECPKIIVRTFAKDRKTFMGSKSGVDNKNLTNTIHFRERDVLIILYAVLTSVSSTYPGEEVQSIVRKDY